jgi:GntR family transcriptional regulator
MRCFGRSQGGYFGLVNPSDRRGRIEHDGEKLLWRQVADDLAADISSGALRPGERLPGELELAENYGVSRITVRRAVADLKERGLVNVVHGKGTFVPKTGK